MNKKIVLLIISASLFSVFVFTNIVFSESYTDLIITSSDIKFEPSTPTEGDELWINFNFTIYGSNASNLIWKVYEITDESNWILITTSPYLNFSAGSVPNSVRWTHYQTVKAGAHKIRVILDPYNSINESNEENNYADATVEVQPKAIICTDSENGTDYFKIGCISLCNYTASGGASSCSGVCDSCNGNVLKELYCENNQSKYINYECPAGYICKNGACIKETSNQTCTDSDGGVNYFIKGCTSICTFTQQGGGCGPACDICSGNVLTEGYCEGKEGKTIKYTCPADYVCKDGACISSNQSDVYNVVIKASDPSDYYLRDWNIFTFDPSGTYQGGGVWGKGAPIKTSNFYSGSTWNVNLSKGTYYLVIGQSGGESYGKYAGNLIINGVVVPFANADVNHAIPFTVPSIATCVNHDECSQVCDNLGINSKWMGLGYSYKSWQGSCPTSVYGCMTGKCCLGQCAYKTTGECFCQRTNLVDIYGSVCPEGTTCGNDCYCHPIKEEFNFNIKTDKYSYSLGENVRITAILSGGSINFNDATVTAIVTDSQGKQIEIKMSPTGTSSSTCTQSVTGTYTCSITTEYHFVGNYNIPLNGPVGDYKIMSTVVAGGIKKSAETKFQVGKTYDDYVDVSINPQEQLTHIGKEVKYDVTIIDKHPAMKCDTITTVTTAVGGGSGGTTQPTGGILTGQAETETSKCIVIYNYLINVDGLPYNTVFPFVVSVHAGSSKTFELKVFPSPVKTAEGIATAVETTTSSTSSERTVSITGKPIATETKDGGEFSTTPVTSILKEAFFKFAVKASLKEEATAADTAIGILRVRYVEEPEPPPFPEPEKINIELRKGWNFISVPGNGIGFIKGTCSDDQKPLAFVYLQDENRYASLEEALKIIGKERLLDYLSTHSFWIYSYDDCNIGFKFKGYSTYSGLYIYQGWNLLGTTKDMIGETLSNIKGSCTFEKIYSWNADSQKWIEKSESDLIEKMGYGALVKTTTSCKLKENVIQPPPFPGSD